MRTMTSPSGNGSKANIRNVPLPRFVLRCACGDTVT
jgi:hypothetical protein